MATAFLIPEPASNGAKITGPSFWILFLTMAWIRSDLFWPSPTSLTMALTSFPAFIWNTRSFAFSGVRFVKTTPLIRAAGSWSFMPISDVSYRPIWPSNDRFAERAASRLFEGLGDGIPSFHYSHGAVVQVHRVFTTWLLVKEMIEGNDAINIYFRNAQAISDICRSLIRYAPEFILYIMDDIQHHGSIFAMLFHGFCD